MYLLLFSLALPSSLSASSPFVLVLVADLILALVLVLVLGLVFALVLDASELCGSAADYTAISGRHECVNTN